MYFNKTIMKEAETEFKKALRKIKKWEDINERIWGKIGGNRKKKRNVKITTKRKERKKRKKSGANVSASSGVSANERHVKTSFLGKLFPAINLKKLPMKLFLR